MNIIELLVNIVDLLEVDIIDLHEDIGTSIGDPNFETHGQVDLDQLRKSNVKLVLTTNYWRTPEEDPRIKDEGVVREYEKRMKSNEKIVRNREDLNNLAGEGINLLLVQEGFITPEPSNPSEANDRLRELWDLGVRVLQPVYWGFEKHWRKEKEPGSIGSSAFDRLELGEEQGLTDLGEKVCKEWLKMGGIIDASHSSPQTLRDIVKICKEEEKPLLISHTGIASRGEYPRSLKFDQLMFLKRELTDVDFLVGAGLSNLFFKRVKEELEREPNLWSWRFMLRDIGRVIGYDHVAIGSDLGGAFSGLVGGHNAKEIFSWISFHFQKGKKNRKVVSGNAKRFLRKALPRE